MSKVNHDALVEMETAIFDVRDWGEAVHMAAAALPDETERAAIKKLGRTIASLGENLRERWQTATGFGGVQR